MRTALLVILVATYIGLGVMDFKLGNWRTSTISFLLSGVNGLIFFKGD